MINIRDRFTIEQRSAHARLDLLEIRRITNVLFVCRAKGHRRWMRDKPRTDRSRVRAEQQGSVLLVLFHSVSHELVCVENPGTNRESRIHSH